MAIDLLFFSSTSRIPSPNPNPSPESPSDFEPVCGANSKMGLAKRNIGSSSLEMDSRRVSSWSSSTFLLDNVSQCPKAKRANSFRSLLLHWAIPKTSGSSNLSSTSSPLKTVALNCRRA